MLNTLTFPRPPCSIAFRWRSAVCCLLGVWRFFVALIHNDVTNGVERNGSGSVVMADMGVDIRVPSGWVVGSAAVEGKKCIGTHSGSCECWRNENSLRRRIKPNTPSMYTD